MNQAASIGQSKLEEMRELIDSMQDNFYKSKQNLEKIKQIIHYKPK
jgi:uncharacterized membrane protein (DUF106 family)